MTDPTSQALLDDRYGRGRKRTFDKRFAWISGVTLVLAGVVFLLFGGWQQGSDLEFKDLHYSVVDAQSVEVEVQVTGSADLEIICALEALSESHGTVGWKLVTLPSADDRTRRFTSIIETTSPATTGRVRTCWEQHTA